MIIPKSIFDLLPSNKDDLIEIEATLTVLKDYRLPKLYPNQIGKPVLPRTTFRILSYQQVVTYRIYDLVLTILSAWENKQISSAFVLLRAVNENTSVIFDANKRLEALISEGDFYSIYKLVYNLQHGTRLDEVIEERIEKEINYREDNINVEKEKLEIREAYTAQQILSVMDRISKYIPTHRGIYEYLCEYAHPNWSGLEGLYCKWENNTTVNITNDNSYTEDVAKRFFGSLRLFLNMFCEGYDGLLRKHPAITKLSIEDMKKKGYDTKMYEDP